MQWTSSKIPANIALSLKADATSSSSILRETLAILGAPLHKYVTIPLDSSISTIAECEHHINNRKILTYNCSAWGQAKAEH